MSSYSLYRNKHLSEPWFSLIKFKIKQVEGRLNKPGDFQNMIEGDKIEFINNDFGFQRSYIVKIKSIKTYPSFFEYLNNEGIERCLPTVDDIPLGEDVYYKYYTRDDEAKYGIKAFTFE